MTDLRQQNGEIIFGYYDDYASWFFDNYVFMQFFRFSFCMIFFIVLPATGFGLYRWYWWSLYQNIYVPPNRIE
jgi:hypothetical protein